MFLESRLNKRKFWDGQKYHLVLCCTAQLWSLALNNNHSLNFGPIV